jgi:hypothetical protein
MIQNKNTFSNNPFFIELKFFALSGPTILGWIFGILHYPINSKHFLLSVQNGIISLAFIAIYGFIHVLRLFFNFPSDEILLYQESFLSLLYLVSTLFCYFVYRKKEKIVGVQIVQSLLDRMFLYKSK